jgi:hypothetical protein
MKKCLLLIMLVTSCFALSALDIKLKNGRVLTDFSGLGGVAAVPRTKGAKWGVIVFYQNGKRKTVVEVQNFPANFPYMTQVLRRAEQIPAAKAKAAAEQKEAQLEAKEEQERQKRLKKIAKDAKKGVPVNVPKKSAKTKRKEFKSGSSSDDD